MLEAKIGIMHYDWNGLKNMLRLMGEEEIIGPLFGDERLGWFACYMKHVRQRLDSLVQQVEGHAATEQESAWIDNVKALRQKYKTFDFDVYHKIKGAEKDKYVMDFALGCAKILQVLVEDYIHEENKRRKQRALGRVDEEFVKIDTPLECLAVSSRMIRRTHMHRLPDGRYIPIERMEYLDDSRND